MVAWSAPLAGPWNAHEIGPQFVAQHPIVAVPLAIVAVIYLFAVMGVAAYDFLSPNLGHLSLRTGLPESIIGVTFMAFGNASADIVSSYVAIRKGSPLLAIGSIIGAAMFVIGVVIGLMGLVSSFKVEKRQFIRDAVFLLAASLLLTYSLIDGVLTFYESMAMVLLYILYAATVIHLRDPANCDQDCQDFNDVVVNQMHVHPTSPHSGERSTLLELPGHHGEYHDQPSSPLLGPIRPSLYSAIEFRDGGDDRSPSSPQTVPTLDTGGLGQLASISNDAAIPVPKSPTETAPAALESTETTGTPDVSETPGVPAFQRPAALRRNRSSKTEEALRTLPKLSIIGPEPTEGTDRDTSPNSLTINVSSGPRWSESPLLSPLYSRRSSFDTEAHLARHEHSMFSQFFPGFTHWSDKTVFAKLNAIIMAPALFLLAVSIPLEETHHDTRILEVQSIFAPITLLLLWFTVSPLSVLATLVASFVLFHLTASHHDVVPNGLINLVGFTMSIMWVVRLANVVLDLAQFLGAMLHISDSVLGLVLIAIGNSAGDLVSNLALAKMGYSTMALAASLGSPLLNMMLGIGGSSFVIMLVTGTRHIETPMSASIMASEGFLIATVVGLLVIIPSKAWTMTRGIGVVAVLMWVGSIVATVVFYAN